MNVYVLLYVSCLLRMRGRTATETRSQQAPPWPEFSLPTQLLVTFSPLLHRYSEHIGAREMLGTFVSFCGQLHHSTELQYVKVTITLRFYRLPQKKKRGTVVLAHAMKAYSGRIGIAPLILNLDNRWEWVDNVVPQHFPGEEQRSHWIQGWMGPRAGLDVVPAKIRNPDHPVRSLFATPTF
jgi:hypothetical protein